MKRVYEDAKKMLEREIEEITRKGNIGMDDISLLDKLLDNLKDISIICSMEDEGYSEGESYARRRDSMGRYASRSYDSYGNGSYRGSYGDSYRGSYEDGYSGHEDYDKMMSEARTEKERELIRQLKELNR